MIRTGKVVSMKRGRPMVCFERSDACARCGACGGGRRKSVIAVYGQANVGDRVDVEMPDAQVVKASVIAYALPLAGLIGGLFLGNALFGSNELAMLLTGLALMGVCYLALRLLDKRLSGKAEWRPQIILIHHEEELTNE